VADEMAHLLHRQDGPALRRQDMVHGRGEIARSVDERAVEIEDDDDAVE